MQSAPSVRSKATLEAADLAFGRYAMKLFLAVNSLLLSVLAMTYTDFDASLRDLPLTIFLVESLLLTLVFLPVLVFRIVRKRETLKLAAARAAHWLLDSVGMAA